MSDVADRIADEMPASNEGTANEGTVMLDRPVGLGPELTQLGPYRIEAMIGRGAMGNVYRAEHTSLKRKVALKIVTPELTVSPQRRKRFRREMEAVGRLDHPNLVRATDAGEVDGVQFLVMELIDALDLDKQLRRLGRFDVGSACEVARQVAVGLEHVRQAGLVHRDIKPSNLLLTSAGVVKILDLGIAMLREDDASGSGTSMGGVMGTPDYVAPEQVSHASDVDIRADIYSLGCTLYTLLIGRPPFDGPDQSTNIAKLIAHTNAVPTPLGQLRPELPPELCQVVERMMAKKPDDRFPTPQAVVDALGRFADVEALKQQVASSAQGDVAGRVAAELEPLSGVARLGHRCRHLFHHHHRWSLAAGGLIMIALLALPRGLFQRAGRPSASDGRYETVATSVQSDDPLNTIAANASAIRQTTEALQQTGRNIDDNTQRIAESLEDLRAAFLASAQHRGIIEHPRSAGEIYHNARAYETLGNPVEARNSYLEVFRSGAEYIDVHLQFQQLIRLQEGPAGAQRVYRELPVNDASIVRRFANLLLEEDLTRRAEQLQQLYTSSPTFAPAAYELSRCVSRVAQGTQSLNDKVDEKRYLTDFLRLANEGDFLTYFLDPAAAAAWENDARQRLTTLQDLQDDVLDQPVQVRFSRAGNTWTVTVVPRETARAIYYRCNSSDELTPTGHFEWVDPVTQAPVPIAQFILPPSALHAQEIQIAYDDIKGQRQGPFTIPFQLNDELVKAAKRQLMLQRNQWVTFGQGEQANQLSFAYFARYREVLREIRYTLGDDPAVQLFAFPDGAPRRDELFATVPIDVPSVTVQLVFTDGSESESVRIQR